MSLLDFVLLPGAEINFLNLRLRRYDRTDKTVLNRLDVLGIRSLSPADELFSPLSFTVSLALAREEDPATGREGYVLNGSVGAGKTVAAADNLYFYALAGVAGGYGGFLPRNQYAAIELTAGLRKRKKAFLRPLLPSGSGIGRRRECRWRKTGRWRRNIFLTITQGKTMMKNFPFPFVIISELLSKKLAE